MRAIVPNDPNDRTVPLNEPRTVATSKRLAERDHEMRLGHYVRVVPQQRTHARYAENAEVARYRARPLTPTWYRTDIPSMAMIEQQQATKPVGRPSLYTPKMPKRAYRMALLGLTLDQMANAFGVDVSTVKDWMNAHNEFAAALNSGRDDADSKVAKSLFQRAIGYSHNAVKIFLNKQGEPVTVPYVEHYPPDPIAAIFWLKNRQPGQWRDKIDHDVTVTGRLAKMDDDERAGRALELVRGMLGKGSEAIESTAIDVTPEVDDKPE